MDFDARAGEILGIGGLLGSGRSELLLSIFGSEPIVEGEIKIDGETGQTRRPAQHDERRGRAAHRGPQGSRAAAGAVDPGERHHRQPASRDRGRGCCPEKNRPAAADKLLDSLRLRAGSYDQPVSTLSGGNQQKVLLARWLLTKPKVIMFDEPTKGIDVGAKGELYDVINDLARQGLAVIVVSSYLPELLGLSDRVLVLRDEEIAGELPGGASEEDVLRLASGGVVRTGAERDHLHGIPALVNDPHFNPVIHQNIEKVSRCLSSSGASQSRPPSSPVARDDDTPQRTPAATASRRWRQPPRRGDACCEPRQRVTTLGDIAGRESGALVVLLVAVGALTLASHEFLTGNNLANLARQVAIFGILAIGQLLVILTGGIDLSVGSILGLSGAITAQLLVGGLPSSRSPCSSGGGGRRPGHHQRPCW